MSLLDLLNSSRDVLTRNMRTYTTALTSITSLYERPVYMPSPTAYMDRKVMNDDDDDAKFHLDGSNR